MKKLDIFKAAAELVVSVGVGTIIGNTIKLTTPADIHLIKKICVGAGAFALSGMVGDLAANHVSQQIDETAEKAAKMLNRGVEEDPEED